MIREHTNAIIRALKDEFNIIVYDETIKQGFKEPCFHVLLIPSIERKNIRTYDFNLTYIIKYFTNNTNDPYNESIDIYGHLCLLLERINGVNCTEFGYNYSDRVLSVECTYKLRGITQEEFELMRNMKYEIKRCEIFKSGDFEV